MLARENALRQWVAKVRPGDTFTLAPLAGDASFRRYFRLQYPDITYIVMDAPPDKEAVQPFLQVADALRTKGIQVPDIVAHDVPQGFLLLSDFGDTLLLDVLQGGKVEDYYRHAMDTLITLQTVPPNNLPCFDTAHMVQEMDVCTTWFFKTYLGLTVAEEEQALIATAWSTIAQTLAQQPQVFIHRDYHSRNLMVQADHRLGVIDFQDAMCGPALYDVVSLLKDCYIAWPREKVLAWVNYFYTQSPHMQSYSLEDCIRAVDWCGLQRHIKVLGVFSRLFLRDNKPAYLHHLPLTLQYVLECCEMYEALHPLYHFLQKRVVLP